MANAAARSQANPQRCRLIRSTRAILNAVKSLAPQADSSLCSLENSGKQKVESGKPRTADRQLPTGNYRLPMPAVFIYSGEAEGFMLDS
jgi:hypothetical protein